MSLLSPQLEAFLAIVQHKMVHGAADAIHITQTAVTQRIRALESRLKTTLFIRTRRGMMPTPEGEALLRYCNAARELEGEALANIQGAAIETEIRINMTGPSSVMLSRIIPKCLHVMKKFPQLLLRFDVNDLETRVQSLRAGENQLAVIHLEDVAPEMEYKILRPERYVLVCTSEWRSRKLREIIQSERIIDFDPTDQVTFEYLKKYNLFHISRHDRYFANRTDAIAMLILSGCGYGVLTKEFSQSYVNSGQLIVINSGKIYENALALAWYPRHEPPRYFKALVDSID